MNSWRIGFLTIRGGTGILATLIIAAAVALGFAPEFVESHIALKPDSVLGNFELWQFVTYAVVPEARVWSIFFSVVIVLGMGGQLEMMWGTARFFRVVLGIAFVSGVLTTVVALFASRLGAIPFPGAHIVTLVIWVGLGLTRRHQTIQFWGGITVTGYTFAMIGFGFSFFFGLYSGTWLVIVPDVFAAIATFLVVHQNFPASALLRFKNWRLQRDLDKRSAHLKSIDGGQRNVGRDSDKYLH